MFSFEYHQMQKARGKRSEEQAGQATQLFRVANLKSQFQGCM